MTEKTTAWAIVRTESTATDVIGRCAIKAVYDSEDLAVRELERLRTESGSHYDLVRTRRIVSGSGSLPVDSSEKRIQGFPATANHSNGRPMEAAGLRHLLQMIVESLATGDRQRTVGPLLARIAENRVATALQARRAPGPQPEWDLEYGDGLKVEVKTILLDPALTKAPHVLLRHPWQFDKLALVVFWPDLNLHSGKLLPAAILDRFVRPGASNRDQKVGLRVTEAMLASPEISDIFPSPNHFWNGDLFTVT